MEDILQLLTDNLIIILVVIGAIIMIVVGYIADKTDFWHKKKTDNKKEEKEEPKEEIDLSKIENKKLGDIYDPNGEKVEDLSAPTNNAGTQDLNAPFGEIISANKINEDLNAPFGDQVIKSNDSSVFSTTITTESNQNKDMIFDTPNNLSAPLSSSENLNAPLGDTTNNDLIKIEELPTISNDEGKTNQTVLNEDLNAPFGDAPVTTPSTKVETQPVTEVTNVENNANSSEFPTIEVQPVENVEQPTIETVENPVEQIEVKEPVTSEFPTVDIQPVENVEQPTIETVENPVEQVEVKEPVTSEFPTVDVQPVENIEIKDEPLFEVNNSVAEPAVEVATETTTSNYSEPIVPEFITEDFKKEEVSNEQEEISQPEDEIWKF